MEHQRRRSSNLELPFQQLLRDNHLGIIENPLRRIPEDRLSRDIGSFHVRSGLADVVDVATLIRGARLARDEEAFMSGGVAGESLTNIETLALDNEKRTTIWTESREIKIILLTCCVASIAQGWLSSRAGQTNAAFADSRESQAQGAIVGANQAWPSVFGLKIGQEEGEEFRSRDVWIFSATNAIVYFAACSVGAFLCDPLTELFMGRRGALFVAATFTFTASIGEAFTHNWQALFACRLVRGIPGAIARLTGLGQMLTSWQTGTAFGIAISGVIHLIVRDWRFQISSSFIPALGLLLLVFVGSESPRWLIKKQRYCKAYSVLLRLRKNPLLAARDLVFIWAQLEVETTLFMRTTDVIDQHWIPSLDQPVLDQPDYLRQIGFLGYARRIRQLFTIPRARRATLASFLVMLSQQLTGVNVFAFLASTLFDYGGNGQRQGVPNRGSLWLYLGFGIANFL
ncbi:MAG: hypothetical protein Q9208_008438 [Pyrenodesmia sp. 3 TL-2023]